MLVPACAIGFYFLGFKSSQLVFYSFCERLCYVIGIGIISQNFSKILFLIKFYQCVCCVVSVCVILREDYRPSGLFN